MPSGKEVVMTRRLIFVLAASVAFAAVDSKGEKDAMAAMESFKQAFLKRDMATLSNLVDDDLVYTHSSGQTQNKAQFLKAVADGPKYVVFDITDPIVHAHGNTVVMRVTVDLRNASAADTPAPLSVLYVWMKGGQGWQLVARQATKPTPAAPAQKK
jgi:ketosteroid isomerase-like protein